MLKLNRLLITDKNGDMLFDYSSEEAGNIFADSSVKLVDGIEKNGTLGIVINSEISETKKKPYGVDYPEN